MGDSVAIPGNQNTDITIRNCEFTNGRRQGISAIHARRVHIEGNIFHDISGDLPQAGIDLEANTAAQDVSDVTIIGNKFYDITAQAGLFIATASNVVVTGNTFRNNSVGITISSVTANTNEKAVVSVDHTTDQFEITGHGLSVGDRLFISVPDGSTIPAGAVEGSTYRVLSVVDADHVTLSTYWNALPLNITSNGTLPFSFRVYREDKLNNIVISDNTFKDMITQAVFGDVATVVNITDNVIDGCQSSLAAILLNNFDSSSIENNIILNSTDGEGIFLSGVRSKIVDNIILGTPDEGIRYYGAFASQVKDNILIDCGLDSTQAGDFRYFNNSTISGNIVKDESALGVVVGFNLRGSDTKNNLITDNNMRDSAISDGNSLLSVDFSNQMSTTNILDSGTSYFNHLGSGTTLLEDITADINTINKYERKMIFNTSTNKPVWATGSTAGAVWVDATGATAHTPV